MGRKRNRKESVKEEEPEERYFLKPESVSKHLYCSICQEVFTEPQRAPCGHSYCKTCIHQWLKTSKTCPEDRLPLKISDMHHDFILENIIGDQMVACPFRGNGCNFIDQLQLLVGHKKKCDFNPKNLPEFIKKDLTQDKLRKNSVKAELKVNTDFSDDDSDSNLPELNTPPLKMRLFQASGGNAKILCSMFGEKSSKS